MCRILAKVIIQPRHHAYFISSKLGSRQQWCLLSSHIHFHNAHHMAQAQTASQREYEQQLQIQSLQATVTQLQAENHVLKAAKVSYE